MRKIKVHTARPRYSVRVLLRAFTIVGLFAVCAPAFAQWEVTDADTHTKIDSMKSDVNERLDKIYKQSHVKQDDAYDSNKNKTLNLQDDNDGKMRERDDASTLQTSRCRVESKNAIGAAQSDLCKDMVTKEVKLNNYLIKMLELTKKRQEELNAILQERKEIESETEFGSLESNTNKLLALQAQIQIDQMNLQLTTDSYSRYFADQNAKLADLARDLQRGKGDSSDGLLRSAMLTGVLAAAHLYKSDAQD